jgi:hypothetical protein
MFTTCYSVTCPLKWSHEQRLGKHQFPLQHIAANESLPGSKSAKHVPERYDVNEYRRPLLDNGFSYHGIAGVSGTTQTWNTVVECLELMDSMRAA